MLNPNIKSEQSGLVFFNYTVIITVWEQKGHLCDELEGKINHLTTFDSAGWWTSWGWGFTYNCDIYTLNVSLKYLSANEMIVIKCDFAVWQWCKNICRADLKVGGSDPVLLEIRSEMGIWEPMLYTFPYTLLLALA